jgi:hypothetical protein
VRAVGLNRSREDALGRAGPRGRRCGTKAGVGPESGSASVARRGMTGGARPLASALGGARMWAAWAESETRP